MHLVVSSPHAQLVAGFQTSPFESVRRRGVRERRRRRVRFGIRVDVVGTGRRRSASGPVAGFATDGVALLFREMNGARAARWVMLGTHGRWKDVGGMDGDGVDGGRW